MLGGSQAGGSSAGRCHQSGVEGQNSPLFALMPGRLLRCCSLHRGLRGPQQPGLPWTRQQEMQASGEPLRRTSKLQSFDLSSNNRKFLLPQDCGSTATIPIHGRLWKALDHSKDAGWVVQGPAACVGDEPHVPELEWLEELEQQPPTPGTKAFNTFCPHCPAHQVSLQGWKQLGAAHRAPRKGLRSSHAQSCFSATLSPSSSVGALHSWNAHCALQQLMLPFQWNSG